MDALIAVDVQADFLPGGSLAVPAGEQVVPELERLARDAPVVVATRDWHTPDDPSFQAQGGPWPVHCVQDTPGAQLHPRIAEIAEMVVDKPTNDATFRTTLVDDLRGRGVERVTVGGLALEYCVLETAMGLRRAGFDVTVAVGATRPVTEVGADDARRELEEAGAHLA